ncbi:hypothetical protein GY45DRAFT_1253663, partial [Cubamyces sp. BRFM 1775]
MDNRPPATVLRSDQIPPALSQDDLHSSVAAANPHTILLPSLPHLPRHPKHHPRRPSRRPSTASSAEDKHHLLPPAPSMGELSPSAYSVLSDSPGPGGRPWSPDVRDQLPPPVSAPCDEASIQEMNRKAHAAVAGLRAEVSRLSGV